MSDETPKSSTACAPPPALPDVTYPSILDLSRRSLRMRVIAPSMAFLEPTLGCGCGRPDCAKKPGVTFFDGTPDGLEALGRHLIATAQKARQALDAAGVVASAPSLSNAPTAPN